MGQFPYECVMCGGAYDRCANKCKVGDYDNGCGGLGGQFCWDPKVFCVPDTLHITNTEAPSAETLQYIFDQIKNKPMYGTYTGYGSAKINSFNEHGTAIVIELYEDDEYASEENYIICRMWCASCFRA